MHWCPAKIVLSNVNKVPHLPIQTFFQVNFILYIPVIKIFYIGVQQSQFYLMGTKLLFSFGCKLFQPWCQNKNTLWGRSLIYQRFYIYINLLSILSFPNALVRTKLSYWDIKGVQYWLQLWLISTLMSFGLLRPNLSPLQCRTRCLLIALCCKRVQETKLQCTDRLASPSACKNTWVVLEQFRTWRVFLYLLTVMLIFLIVSEHHLLQKTSFQWGGKKSPQR